MSQEQWDTLEEIKQDIIDGKILYEFWDLTYFEAFEDIDDPLTEKEMIEVFKRFPGYSEAFYEIAFETLEHIVEDVMSEREKTKT